MFATFPILFTETYGFSTGLSGLVSLDDDHTYEIN